MSRLNLFFFAYLIAVYTDFFGPCFQFLYSFITLNLNCSLFQQNHPSPRWRRKSSPSLKSWSMLTLNWMRRSGCFVSLFSSVRSTVLINFMQSFIRLSVQFLECHNTLESISSKLRGWCNNVYDSYPFA